MSKSRSSSILDYFLDVVGRSHDEELFRMNNCSVFLEYALEHIFSIVCLLSNIQVF